MASALALLGVWFRQHDCYVEFADDLERLKREVWGPRPDKPVNLHRSDIINRRGPFGVLLDEEKRRQFDDGLIEVISRARFRIVCVIIDKKAHRECYVDPFHPYHFCLAAMLDRYSGWLNYWNGVGDVMAEARGKEEDIQLTQAYTRVYESGTLMFDREHHQRALTTKDIKLQRKHANIAGLQLADLLAHPLKQECLIARGLIPDTGATYGKRVCDAVQGKYNRHERTKAVAGYGTVWLPHK